ncbi:Mov34/MPN/PAD-1 family protein [Methanospirillum sp.]|uniref:Mov34/MPN/PAD-1 family protein n=1 Tax=Methanospirillum sp. TaxID=45200 RepID=UPI0035A0227E
MNISAIQKDTLELLLAMGRESHPREFAALLSAKSGIISDINLIPGSIGGKASAQVPFDMVPLGMNIIGSAHSHPNGIIRPSDADIRFFSVSGSRHIIVGDPYGPDDWGCFSPDGIPVRLKVVP